eukprot:21059-Eustigmatos_ZCMA.PRE.1
MLLAVVSPVHYSTLKVGCHFHAALLMLVMADACFAVLAETEAEGQPLSVRSHITLMKLLGG